MTLLIGILGPLGGDAGIGVSAGVTPREDVNSRKATTTTTITTMAMTIIPPVDIEISPTQDVTLTEAHAHRMRGSPAPDDRRKTIRSAIKRSQNKTNGKQNFPLAAAPDRTFQADHALAWLRTSPA
jgi:hypothetical protein